MAYKNLHFEKSGGYRVLSLGVHINIINKVFVGNVSKRGMAMALLCYNYVQENN